MPEEAIAYNYKEVGIHNLAELRCAKVQLGHIINGLAPNTPNTLLIRKLFIVLLGSHLNVCNFVHHI